MTLTTARCRRTTTLVWMQDELLGVVVVGCSVGNSVINISRTVVGSSSSHGCSAHNNRVIIDDAADWLVLNGNAFWCSVGAVRISTNVVCSPGGGATILSAATDLRMVFSQSRFRNASGGEANANALIAASPCVASVALHDRFSIVVNETQFDGWETPLLASLLLPDNDTSMLLVFKCKCKNRPVALHGGVGATYCDMPPVAPLASSSHN